MYNVLTQSDIYFLKSNELRHVINVLGHFILVFRGLKAYSNVYKLGKIILFSISSFNRFVLLNSLFY